MPLYFRLLRVRLPPLEQATYAGPNAVLYDLSGGLAASIGSTAQTVSEGAGTFIPAGTTTFRASAEPASFLIFMLSPAADSEKAPLSGLATVEDLYRTPGPVPDLKAGPYEFSMTRVALPAGMPMNPAHYQSGAALYYILAGTGADDVHASVIDDDRTAADIAAIARSRAAGTRRRQPPGLAGYAAVSPHLSYVELSPASP